MQVKHNLLTFLLWICVSFTIFGQDICNPTLAVDTSGYEGVAIFNYASTSKIKNQKFQSALALGQIFTGYIDNSAYNSNVGFYGRYLLPPFALKVNATQGDLLDRIQLTWELDALGPSPNEGFNIYRNGIFLATVGPNIRNYNDFNVIAGLAYTYSVRGLNAYGEGTESYALGFQVPNGVVTGWIRTQSGSPVPDAVVSLMPMQGFSASFGYSDKASAIAEGTSMFLTTNQNWSTTFWVKTDTALTQATVMSYGKMLLYVRAIQSSTGQEGIMVANSPSAAPFLTAVFPDSVKHDWNHIALTFEDASSLLRIYLNGVLVQQATFNDLGITGETTAEEESWRLGNAGHTGGWKGKIDEVRIYSTLLEELDLPDIMHGTASSLTPNLDYYWKMDEELGEKSYDLLNRVKLFFCGAKFDVDRPPVRTSGKTNNEGYYRIESASYGTGTTFLAEASKSFFLQKSVKFTRSENTNATLPNFALPKKSTIELWVNNSSSSGIQTIVSKKSPSNDFKVFLEPSGINQVLKISLNGSTQSYGNLGTGFQHIAITIDSISNNVQVFKNGTSIGMNTFSGLLGNLAESNTPWRLGAHHNGSSLTDYFNGLIDEFAVYDTILSPGQINNHYTQFRDMQERHLYVYFPLNEGAGNIVSNVGSNFLSNGTLYNYEWSSFAPNQIEEPHIFSPKTRQVTLNPSVTSVDQVDFIDLSTIPVAGYVRFQNTDCFVPNVEILVNNQSHNPKIFTDSTGKFIVDFDPGFTGTLKPVFEDHFFAPVDWKITNISSPIGGVLFNDQRTRTVSGILAGGLCEKAIIDISEYAYIKVRSVDGCYDRLITIDNQSGTFEIENLPAIERMTVAVIHDNPFIDKYFNDIGAPTVNLSKRDTSLKLIYFEQPKIEIISGLEPFSPTCNTIVMDQNEFKTIEIKLTEEYVKLFDGTNLVDDGICPIDSANFRIINGFGDETVDTTMGGGLLKYKFRVGKPNPSIPYEKSIQIISTTLEGNKGEYLRKGIVTGIFNKLPTFTTQLPETPSLVLHDPPGDGSYAFIEKGQKICENITFSIDSAVGGGAQGIIDLGIDLSTTTFFGIPEVSLATDIGPVVTGTAGFRKVNSNTLEVCNTFNTRISTSENDLIVGTQGGDIFMGSGLNINFGTADIIIFDNATCEAYDSLAAIVQPAGYGTTFIYSEWHIKNAVIPHLQTLKVTALNESTPDTSAINRYTKSISRWNTILSNNDKRKQNAKAIDNFSFSAGATYEYSTTIDSLKSNSKSNAVEAEQTTDFNIIIKAQGIGGGTVLKQYFQKASDKSTNNMNERGITTGYVLKDDDELDAFSVDIGIDSVYKTPIFKIRAGQSSCPWEPNTAKREGVNLVCTNGPVRTDVPANEAASFTFNMGNTSSTLETWTYAFTAGPESNPHGAKIFCNGAPMNQIQWYAIPYGTIIPVTITVERGSLEYDYDSLEIVLYSACEDQRANDLGILPDTADFLYSAVYVSAFFIRPCSEVVINEPEQNFVMFPDTTTAGDDIEKQVTISGYNEDPKFESITLQYRRSNGDGTWIAFPGISKRYNPKWEGRAGIMGAYDTLSSKKYEFFKWNTTGFNDGEYEIRAVTKCTGDASDKPGYSEIIKGKIDRTPPALLGVPQPSDGVYHVGDEISFTFNQDINCQRFMAQLNSAKLFKAATNTPLVISKSCVGNKIVIIPDPIFNDNEVLENTILKAEVNNIQDLTGNINTQEIWEFYVDRNELAWLTDSIEVVKFVDETKTISAKIHNRGGYPVPFSIIDVPNWLHVYPDRGTLVANEVEEIFFTVKDDIDLGEISDNVLLRTETGINPFFMGGDEPLHVKARNLCRPESWVLNPGSFKASDLSMNFVVQLNIEGTLSADENDIVGAYVDGQLRGIAKVEYVASQNKYLAFLTVYGDTSMQQIKFQIWDASDCKLYAYAVENFIFKANDVKGTISNCIILHTNTTLLRKIFIHEGWNWLSMNLDLVPNTINNALMSLSNPTGAYIQGQTGISGYEEIGSIWVGSLNNLLPTKLYQYLSEHKDSLSIIGNYIDPTSRPMPLDSGWNWIGYLPTQILAVNDALATFNATEGDIIKSQLQFAQYVNGTGWVGNLKTMNAPNGYLLRLNKKDTLIYPDPLAFRSGATSATRNLVETNQHGMTDLTFLSAEAMPFERWQVNPAKYEHTMSIIAIVLEKENNENILHDGDEVGAFVNDEVRGSGKAIHIPSLNAYMIFMTVYANVDGEKLTFKFFDASSNKEMKIAEEMNFKINKIIGKVSLPEPLYVNTTTAATNELGSETDFNVFPNPFNSTLTVKYKMIQGQDVKLSIKDIHGKVVEFKEIPSKSGMNVIEWKPSADLIYGVYLLSIESNENSVSKKVLYLK